MASFNDFSNNIYRYKIYPKVHDVFVFFFIYYSDTLAICIVTWFTSIFGGFAIFTVLGKRKRILVFMKLCILLEGHMATKMGVSVADVAKGGK